MKPEIKKLLILNLPYLLFVWLFDKVGAAVRLSPGADASAKLLHLGDGFTAAFSSIAPSFHPADLLIGIAGAVIVRLIIYTKGKNAKKYRRGTEYGSARWGGADDIKPYTDPVFENNIPLTQTERLTMNSRPKQPKYARNKNILVIGGSGSGKTRFFVKPSLMQCTSKDFPTSYIVTDPKGTLILETGKMLQRYKYRIKVLNTINFKKSMKYNPFAYLRSEKDILKLVNTIIANTKGDGEKSGEGLFAATVLDFGSITLPDGTMGVYQPRKVDGGYYMAYNIMAVTAVKDTFIEWESILTECMKTLQYSESFVSAANQASNEGVALSQQISQSFNETMDGMMSCWENRDKSQDILSQKQSDATLGYERFYDTETGEIYRAAIGFGDSYDGKRYQPVTDDNMYTEAISGYIERLG